MKNGVTLQIKDACRNCLTNLLQDFELEQLRKYLSKEDSDFLTEIEGKFVAKKYNSRIKEKMGTEKPKTKNVKKAVKLKGSGLEMSSIQEKDESLESSTVDTENLNTEARKIKLKFGKLEFKDNLNNPVSNTNYNSDEEEEGGELADFFRRENIDLVVSKNEIIWDLFKKSTFLDCINKDYDITVKLICLEEMYLVVRKARELYLSQKWNISKFVYFMISRGKKIEFLKKYRSLKLPGKSSNDALLRNLHLGVRRTKKKKIKILRANKTEIEDLHPSESSEDEGNQYSKKSEVPPKFIILLLLIANEVVSYKSTLLLEPLIYSLGDEHPGIR